MGIVFLYGLKIIYGIFFVVTYPLFFVVETASKMEGKKVITAFVSLILLISFIWTCISTRLYEDGFLKLFGAIFYFLLLYGLVCTIISFFEDLILMAIIFLFDIFHKLHVLSKEGYDSISSKIYDYHYSRSMHTISDDDYDKDAGGRSSSSGQENKDGHNSCGNGSYYSRTYTRTYRNKSSWENSRTNHKDHSNSSRTNSSRSSAGSGAGYSSGQSKYENALRTLHMEEPFTLDELKKQRKLLIKLFHPDNANDPSGTRATEINNAYDILFPYAKL